MSRLSSFMRARTHPDDSAPPTDAAAEFRIGDSYARGSRVVDARDLRDAELDENVFNLLPPEPVEFAAPEAVELAAPEPVPDPIPEPEPQGQNHHPVDMTDLSRLSIDHDGRLYWDGKPVETHHRFAMSRNQIVGASLIAALVAIGAFSAAIQGAAAARDWTCWLGWSASACTLPGGLPRHRSDIPT